MNRKGSIVLLLGKDPIVKNRIYSLLFMNEINRETFEVTLLFLFFCFISLAELLHQKYFFLHYLCC